MYPAKSRLSSAFYASVMSVRTNSKDENFLFSPAIFDPDRSPGTNRGKANIAYLRNIVLDFENGELRPEELPNLFPGLRMVVTNTFSHTSDKPRFRAVFPTSEIMTPEVYGLIQGCLADKLEDAGYVVDRGGKGRKGARLSNSRPSGLDWSKSLPTSLFYLPCQAQKSGDSFFPGIWRRQAPPLAARNLAPEHDVSFAAGDRSVGPARDSSGRC